MSWQRVGHDDLVYPMVDGKEDGEEEEKGRVEWMHSSIHSAPPMRESDCMHAGLIEKAKFSRGDCARKTETHLAHVTHGSVGLLASGFDLRGETGFLA